jgi:hypothetical protein
LIGEWNLPRVSLAIKIFILISIGKKIILDFHWFMKDEGAIDWKERFSNFHWIRRTSSRKGLKGVPRRDRSILCFWRKEKK